MSPLFRLAIASGKVESVLLHLAGGADPNGLDSHGSTPLIVAAARGRSEIVDILLAHGANPVLVDAQGRKPAEHAKAWGFAALAESLERYGGSHTTLVPDDLSFAPQPDPNQLVQLDEAASAFNWELATNAPPISIASGLSDLDARPIHEAPTTSLPPPLLGEAAAGEDAPSENGGEREWEPEPEVAAPTHDGLRAIAALAVQIDISRQRPATADQDWSDVSASLPRRLERPAKPLHPLIAGLLTEGLVQGSVTKDAVARAAARTCRNAGQRRRLRDAIVDLGILIEESPIEALLREQDYAKAVPESFREDLDAVAIHLDNDSHRALNPDRIYRADIERRRDVSAAMQTSLWSRAEELRSRIDTLIASCPGGAELLRDCSGRASLPLEVHVAELIEAVPEVDDDDAGDEADSDEGVDETSFEVEEEALGATLPIGQRTSMEGYDRAITALFERKHEEIARQAELALEQLRRILRVLVEANLALVPWVARRYRDRGLLFADLVQEGNIGLIKAVEKFEPQRRNKLATYAVWWIRQAMARAIADQGRSIRLPVHVHDSLHRLDRAEDVATRRLGRKPDLSELAIEADITESRVERLNSLRGRLFFGHADNADSLAEADLQRAATENGPLERLEHRDLGRALARKLAELDPRQERVLRLRFGLGRDNDMTLEEVGLLYGVTRERIRQIEAKALRILSHPARAKDLRVLLDA